MSELEPGYEITETEPLSGRMLHAVNRSVELADHLERTDEADIHLARELAMVIDTATESGDSEMIHRASCVPMPTLHKVLTSLGLNPKGRQELGLDSDDEDDGW